MPGNRRQLQQTECSGVGIAKKGNIDDGWDERR
jgi:hypothetical protein